MARELQQAPEFDSVAEGYDSELNQGLALTGESKEYFAEGRMRWVARQLEKHHATPVTALDFGCGTGGSVPHFFEILGCKEVIGIDPSEQSLAVARKTCADRKASFSTQELSTTDGGSVDLAFCNGVFHHIQPEIRQGAVEFIFDKLKPGGIFAFWENNAWNPMTRFLMSRVPFDKDAILVFPSEARRLLGEAGFQILSTDYHFIFPKILSALRCLEPAARRIPLGGQYLVLAQKP